MTRIADYWRELVGVGLLGTDRRTPPAPPPGPLADLAADQPLVSPVDRVVQGLAACTAVRRAGLLPWPAVAALAPPQPDDRPTVSPAAVLTWREVVATWPQLEDEWLLTVVSTGRRLAPEMIDAVLARHRGDAVRHARALLAAGAIGEWLIGHLPHLAPRSAKPASVDQVVSLPELAVSAEVWQMLGGSPQHAARAVAHGFATLQIGPAHRGVLVNALCRVSPDRLRLLAAALDGVDPSSAAIGVALALADLARLRARMLDELSPGTLDD